MHRRAVAVLAATLAVALGGCALVEAPDQPEAGRAGETADQSPSVSQGESTADGAVTPEGLPTSFDREAQVTFPEDNVYGGELVGDVVLTMTLNALRGRQLPDGDRLYELAPEIGGHLTDIWSDRESGYVLEARVEEEKGTSVGSATLSVRRFGLSSGAVDGTADGSLRRDPQSDGRPVFEIGGVAGDVALVESWVPAADNTTERGSVMALDLESGEKVWQARPARVVTTTDDTVLLSTGSHTEPGRIEAREARSGKLRWQALPGVTSAALVGVDRGAARLVTTSFMTGDAMMSRLSLRTGKVTTAEPVDEASWSCTTAVAQIAVCSLPNRHALGYDLASGKVVWQLPTPRRYGMWVTAVEGGHVYGFTSGGRSVVLDARTGRDSEEPAGAAPSTVSPWGGLVLYAGKAIFYPSANNDG